MNTNHNASILAAAFGDGGGGDGEVISLYDALGVSRAASAAELRKAYYRKSLACHPDKVGPGREIVFQAVTIAYNLLKDPDKRRDYDETGVIADDDDDDVAANAANNHQSFDAMKDYFKTIFGTVTTSKIDLFAEKYKCSREEEEDVLKYYQQFKGNFKKMLENVMLSSERDAPRWMEDYIQPAVDAGTVPAYPKTVERTLAQCQEKLEREEGKMARTAKVEEEDNDEAHDDDDDDDAAMEVDDDATESDHSTEEEEEVATRLSESKKRKSAATQKKKATTTGNKKKTPAAGTKKRINKKWKEEREAELLMAKIQSKQNAVARKQNFDSMLSGLATKYGGKKNKKSSNNMKDDDPLDDEAFQKIQATLSNNKKTNKKKQQQQQQKKK